MNLYLTGEAILMANGLRDALNRPSASNVIEHLIRKAAEREKVS